MKNLLVIIFAFLSIVASATNYYVSSAGNDSNNGTSTSTPWQTIAKVNSRSFAAGDVIYFNKGNIWREMLTVPSSGSSGSPVTFSSYGSGNDPVISCSDLAVTWTRSTSNVWKSSVATQPTVVYFNNTRGKMTSGSCGSQYEWYWSGSTLYVYAPGDANPSTTYTSPGVEVGNRSRALQTNNKEYITFNHITFRDGNSLSSPCVYVGSSTVNGFIMQYCTIERSTFTGINFLGSSIAASATLDHCTVDDNGSYGVVFSNLYTSANISNNTISRNGWGTVRDGAPASGIAGYLGNVNIFGNTITNNGPSPSYDPSQSHGIYVSSSTSAVANIYNNTISGHGNGSGIKARYPANIHHNHIYGNSRSGIEFGGNDATPVTYTINYNLIHSSTTGSGAGITNGLNGTAHVIIQNNTFYKDGNNAIELSLQFNVPYLTIKNNIFYAADGRRAIDMVAQSGVVAIDYNLYWQDTQSGNPNFKYGSSSPTWTDWKALGFDTHGVNANPLIVSASDFHLKSGSPAIGKGVTISGLTTDYSGSTAKNPPSIGAFESGSSALPPPASTPPVFQSAIVENATSSILQLNYDPGLSSSIVPPVSSYSVSVNGTANTVSSVAVTSNMVQLTLSSAIKYGDVITVSYTAPASNPLQTEAGGIAAGFSSKTATNNLASATKDALPVTVSMAISPYYIHTTINVAFKYSSVLTTAQLTGMTPQILKITDTYGRLFVEKLLISGVTSIKFPINLRRGIYNVILQTNGANTTSKKVMVY